MSGVGLATIIIVLLLPLMINDALRKNMMDDGSSIIMSHSKTWDFTSHDIPIYHHVA